MTYAHDIHYLEKELPREQALRAEAAEARLAVAPYEWPRPDAEQSVAHRLRVYAAELIQFKRYQTARASGDGDWRNQIEDTQQIRDLALEAAVALEWVIVRVLAAADVHESKAREL